MIKISQEEYLSWYIWTNLVVSEISHQPHLDVGVGGDATQNLGALESSFWVWAAVIKIPAGEERNFILQNKDKHWYLSLLMWWILYKDGQVKVHSREQSCRISPGDVDDVISSSGLRADALEELLQRRNQQGGLALPEEIHEHHLLLQSQVQKTQAVQHRRLQVLFTCEEEPCGQTDANYHQCLCLSSSAGKDYYFNRQTITDYFLN